MKTPYWTGVIRRAKKRKEEGKRGFNGKHLELSGSWVTCACGKQDPRIPRLHYGGTPVDMTLFHLAISFCGAVERDHPDDAERVIKQIEIRAAEVLREVK